MKILITILFVLVLAGCSDSGDHYDDPWNPPTADKSYETDPKPVKDTVIVQKAKNI